MADLCTECVQVPVVSLFEQAVLKQNRLFYSENKAICDEEPLISSNAISLNNYKYPVRRTPSPPQYLFLLLFTILLPPPQNIGILEPGGRRRKLICLSGSVRK